MSKSLGNLTVSLELRPSKIHLHGVGVFAIRNVPRGQKVADGVAEDDFETVVPWRESRAYDAKVQNKILEFCIRTPDGTTASKSSSATPSATFWPRGTFRIA